MGEKLTGEQLSLFTIHSVEIKNPLQDPYWDEIECDNVHSSNQTNKHISDDLGRLPCPSQFSKSEVENATQPKTVNSRVGEQVTTDTKKSAHQHDTPTHWVEKYWVERAGNKYWYYRYTWMSGRKLNRLYIGSAQSAIAQNRKSEIEIAIADGETPAGIQNLIQSWSK